MFFVTSKCVFLGFLGVFLLLFVSRVSFFLFFFGAHSCTFLKTKPFWERRLGLTEQIFGFRL